jgi:hypothetical protein
MKVGRSNPVAVSIPGQKVFIGGGDVSGQTAELYNVKNQTFTLTPRPVYAFDASLRDAFLFDKEKILIRTGKQFEFYNFQKNEYSSLSLPKEISDSYRLFYDYNQKMLIGVQGLHTEVVSDVSSPKFKVLPVYPKLSKVFAFDFKRKKIVRITILKGQDFRKLHFNKDSQVVYSGLFELFLVDFKKLTIQEILNLPFTLPENKQYPVLGLTASKSSDYYISSHYYSNCYHLWKYNPQYNYSKYESKICSKNTQKTTAEGKVYLTGLKNDGYLTVYDYTLQRQAQVHNNFSPDPYSKIVELNNGYLLYLGGGESSDPSDEAYLLKI